MSLLLDFTTELNSFDTSYYSCALIKIWNSNPTKFAFDARGPCKSYKNKRTIIFKCWHLVFLVVEGRVEGLQLTRDWPGFARDFIGRAGRSQTCAAQPPGAPTQNRPMVRRTRLGQIYSTHLYHATDPLILKQFTYSYGSISPGRGKWSKCGFFFLELCCDQTVWLFSTVLKRFCLWHSKNVSFWS